MEEERKMGGVRRRILRILRAQKGSLLPQGFRRILRPIWWTFWSLIDEITEGSDLD